MSQANGKPWTAVLGMPGYGHLTAGAARGFWTATRTPQRVAFQYQEGSLLASNFNKLWCGALNKRVRGEGCDYFAMLHADVEPSPWWMDILIAELERHQLDVIGTAIPIKDPHGLTSLALDRPDGDPWNPHCRLTMTEIYRLPETFMSDDLGYRLLINTGCWVARMGDWCKKICFTINDRICRDPETGLFFSEDEPEDWNFSSQCHALGLRLGATRKVKLAHTGPTRYPNWNAWGTDKFDTVAVTESQIPPQAADDIRFPDDVAGWLSYDEGLALADLARGKRVLEIGSYCGRSTIYMAQTAQRVVAVDPFDGRATPDQRDTYSEFCANLDKYGVSDRVIAVTGTIEDVSADSDGLFDLIFIDGNHEYPFVKNDWTRALPLLAPGGVLAFHDYRKFAGEADGRWDPGVTQAVDELLGNGAELLSRHDSLAVVRPKAEILDLVSVEG